jgi:hypothetical protein
LEVNQYTLSGWGYPDRVGVPFEGGKKNIKQNIVSLIEQFFQYKVNHGLNINLKSMKKNMGTVDRVIRILIAIVIAILYFTHAISGTLAVVLLILAAVMLLTSIISFCPIYLPFGINTNKKKE